MNKSLYFFLQIVLFLSPNFLIANSNVIKNTQNDSIIINKPDSTISYENLEEVIKYGVDYYINEKKQIKESQIELIFSVTAVLVSLFVAFLGYSQLRYFRRQLQLNSDIEILKINRELIVLGLENINLLKAFSVVKNKEDEMRKRYFQLWLNQFHMIWRSNKAGFYARDHWDANVRDISNVMKNKNIIEHWIKVEYSYPDKFAKFMRDMIGDKLYLEMKKELSGKKSDKISST